MGKRKTDIINFKSPESLQAFAEEIPLAELEIEMRGALCGYDDYYSKISGMMLEKIVDFKEGEPNGTLADFIKHAYFNLYHILVANQDRGNMKDALSSSAVLYMDIIYLKKLTQKSFNDV